MSMTDEGTTSSDQRSANQNPEKKPGQQNGAGSSGGGLPGLAAFGQMQGYKPVGQQAAPATEPEPQPESVSPEPEPAFTGEPETDAADADYAEQFAQDFVRDFNQQPQPGDNEQGFEQAAHPDAQLNEDAGHESFSSEEIQNYMAQQHGALEAEDYDSADTGIADQAAPYETGNSLETFEAHYDQHPEIPLGAFDEPGSAQADQPFFNEPGEAGDADFLGGQGASDVAQPKERRGRKTLMAASGLIGILALGGALAFAYKIGGDSDIARTGKPPLIQADSRPVKVAPDKPGGKEFPHANKKIYERLGGGNSEEVVKLQPRQEDVAAAATAALGDSGQGTKAPGTSESVLGGPRKVKTLTVRPDGSIEQPAEPRQKVITAPPPNKTTAGAPDGTIAMTFPTAPAAAPTANTQAAAPPPVAPTIPKPVAAAPPPAPQQQASAGQAPAIAAPPPVQKPAVPRVAAAAPASAPAPAASAASSGSYVVQVAARKSQTDALAAFADIQQKYPRLLNGYRPIIKRADLGNKGVWYRLNVGPVESKKVASSLCGQLKSAGMRSCLVRAQ